MQNANNYVNGYHERGYYRIEENRFIYRFHLQLEYNAYNVMQFVWEINQKCWQNMLPS